MGIAADWRRPLAADLAMRRTAGLLYAILPGSIAELPCYVRMRCYVL